MVILYVGVTILFLLNVAIEDFPLYLTINLVLSINLFLLVKVKLYIHFVRA